MKNDSQQRESSGVGAMGWEDYGVKVGEAGLVGLALRSVEEGRWDEMVGDDGERYSGAMLATYLVYAYLRGRWISSELALWHGDDWGLRYLTGGRVLDGALLRRFRRRHSRQVIQALDRVLVDFEKAAPGSTYSPGERRYQEAVQMDCMDQDD